MPNSGRGAQTTSICGPCPSSAPSGPPDPSEMCVLKSCRQLEPIAQRTIKPRMRQPQRAKRHHNRHGQDQAQRPDHNPERIDVHEVIDRRPPRLGTVQPQEHRQSPDKDQRALGPLPPNRHCGSPCSAFDSVARICDGRQVDAAVERHLRSRVVPVTRKLANCPKNQRGNSWSPFVFFVLSLAEKSLCQR